MDRGTRRVVYYLAGVAALAAAIIVIWVVWPKKTKNARPVFVPDRTMHARDAAGSTQPAYSTRDIEAPVEDPQISAGKSMKHVEALIATPQHEWQRERVKNVGRETIEESIRNFAKYDDVHLAETSISGLLPTPSSGRFQVLVVTRLARVRRVLEAGRRSPETVLPCLREDLKKSIADWPGAFATRMKMMDDAERQGKGFTLNEADRFRAITVGAAASTYLVGELGDEDSLPLLLSLHELGASPTTHYGPVPSALVLGAMREIIAKMPELSLNQEARAIRAEFISEAASCLPSPSVVTVTKWNAQWDETDPRLEIMKTGPEVLKDQPRVQMRVYPPTFKDGKEISNTEGVDSPRTMHLFDLAGRFVKAVR